MNEKSNFQQIQQELDQTIEIGYQVQAGLRTNEQRGNDIFELCGEQNAHFQELMEYWHKDPLGQELNTIEDELSNEKRQVFFKLEDERKELLKQKRRLTTKEDELYQQRRLASLELEE